MAIFFIFGILAALFAVVLELSVRAILPENSILFSLSCFALIEESTKLLMLRKTIDPSFHSPLIPKNIILFAVGFISIELSLATLKYPEIPPSAIAGIITLHLATVIWYGYALSRRFSFKFLSLALLIGIIIHFSYNLFLV